jgi:hypothetical protein
VGGGDSSVRVGADPSDETRCRPDRRVGRTGLFGKDRFCKERTNTEPAFDSMSAGSPEENRIFIHSFANDISGGCLLTEVIVSKFRILCSHAFCP